MEAQLPRPLMTRYWRQPDGSLAAEVHLDGLTYRVHAVPVGGRHMALDDVATVITGVCPFSSKSEPHLKRVLSYMTGTSWEKYEGLPPFVEAQRLHCRTELLKQQPRLQGLALLDNEEDIKCWVEEQAASEHGAYLRVFPLAGTHLAEAV